MTVDNPLRQMLAAIQHADMAAKDREILRPAFAALNDNAEVIHLPDYVVKRIRDIHARMAKQP